LVGLASVGAFAAATTSVLGTAPAQAAPFNVHRFNAIQRRLASSALLNVLGQPTSPRSSAGPSPAVVVPGGDENGDGADGAPDTAPAGFSIAGPVGRPANFFPAAGGSCPNGRRDDGRGEVRGDGKGDVRDNIKVNQNCLNVADPDLQGRGQANNETSIAQDPNRPDHLVASDNDYVRGDGTCGAAYSTTGGATWNDSTVPDVFTRGFAGKVRQYWQAGGDTSVAWDTRGNAYLSCQLFNRGEVASNNPDQSSAFAVFRSTGNNGASWNFPGRSVSSFFDPGGTAGVLEDKQLLTVDNRVGSPFQDRIYISWTEFAADGTSYIWSSYSKDYGQTFSPRVLVSSGNTTFCTNTFGAATPNGACNENQYSQPFTGPDGALYVTWSNFNNQATAGLDNRYQVLLSKSIDGGVSFGAPVKVNDYYDLPNCDTYQGAGADPGRSCIPEKGPLTRSVFRAANYPSGAVNPVNNEVVVTFGSYISAASQESNGCVPGGFDPASGNPMYTGVKTPGACSNKILVSRSSNGGASFTGSSLDPRAQTLVPQAPGQMRTDQWWQWAAINREGTLAVSYYDRQYGRDELTGFSDFSLSASRDMVTFGQIRVTTTSLPPPTQFPGPKGGTFWGDYTGLAYSGNVANPIWSDTRSPDIFVCPDSGTGPGNPPRLCSGVHDNGVVANDQELYTALVRPPTP